LIEPEVATRWSSQAAYDRVAALLIGIVAVLAAVFAVQQAHAGLEGTRAQLQGARLGTDAAAALSASSLAQTAGPLARQDALILGMEAVGRQLQGTMAGDEAAVAVGTAQQAAMDHLTAAIAETEATSGGRPVDAYAARLVAATLEEIKAQVDEQGRQVDLAAAAGARELRSVLGLSLIALAGVLAGIAAVMGRRRAGWALLALAWVVCGTAAVTAVSGML
jgi:hypothetical protein